MKNSSNVYANLFYEANSRTGHNFLTRCLDYLFFPVSFYIHCCVSWSLLCIDQAGFLCRGCGNPVQTQLYSIAYLQFLASLQVNCDPSLIKQFCRHKQECKKEAVVTCLICTMNKPFISFTVKSVRRFRGQVILQRYLITCCGNRKLFKIFLRFINFDKRESYVSVSRSFDRELHLQVALTEKSLKCQKSEWK